MKGLGSFPFENVDFTKEYLSVFNAIPAFFQNGNSNKIRPGNVLSSYHEYIVCINTTQSKN